MQVEEKDAKEALESKKEVSSMGNKYVEMGLSAPVNVTWEMTYACNLYCIHCLSDSGKKRGIELSTEQCRQVIDDLSAMKVFQFNFGGGEPLEIKSCESCHRFDLCHGGCPAIAYHTQRKLGVADPGCLENCVRIKVPTTVDA